MKIGIIGCGDFGERVAQSIICSSGVLEREIAGKSVTEFIHNYGKESEDAIFDVEILAVDATDRDGCVLAKDFSTEIHTKGGRTEVFALDPSRSIHTVDRYFETVLSRCPSPIFRVIGDPTEGMRIRNGVTASHALMALHTVILKRCMKVSNDGSIYWTTGLHELSV